MLCMFVRARPAAQEAARPRPVQAAGPLASPAAGRSRKLHGRSHLHEHDFQKRIQHTCHEKLQHACLHALHAWVGPACVPSGGVGTACRRVHACIHIWMNRHVCLHEFKICSALGCLHVLAWPRPEQPTAASWPQPSSQPAHINCMHTGTNTIV